MDQKSQNSRNNSTTHVIQADIHHALHSQVTKPGTAYSDIVKRTTTSQQNPNITRNISTQTDDSDEFLGRNFFDKLKYCLVELFRSSVMKENSIVQNQIIDNVLQQQFGNEIRKHPEGKTEKKESQEKTC